MVCGYHFRYKYQVTKYNVDFLYCLFVCGFVCVCVCFFVVFVVVVFLVFCWFFVGKWLIH